MDVFQSGFRESVPGVPRNVDNSSGILYVVVVIFYRLIYIIILNYEHEVMFKNKYITF